MNDKFTQYSIILKEPTFNEETQLYDIVAELHILDQILIVSYTQNYLVTGSLLKAMQKQLIINLQSIVFENYM